MKPIYFDNNATTMVAPEVTEAMIPFFKEYWGNPSSMHTFGGQVAKYVDEGRQKVADMLNCHPQEIIFTSCATESDNTAIWSALQTQPTKRHIITTAVEHPAILQTCAFWERQGYRVTRLGVDNKGRLNLDEYRDALDDDTAIVSIMWANNEVGNIYPIKKMAEMARERGILFHTDAVQAAGHLPIDVQAQHIDMLSLSGHKFHGPKGVGVLYCRKGVWPQNLIDGGSQEARHRAGTENVAGIAGMGKALEMATTHLEERMAHEQELRDYVIDRILKNIPEARLNGGRAPRLPGNVNISFPGLEGETILLDLDMHGICASTGSACNSDSLDPSHVLLSIGLPEEIGHGSMRFTFGPQNTMEEAKYLCDVLEEVIPRRRAMSCMWLQGQNKARQFSLKGEQ